MPLIKIKFTAGLDCEAYQEIRNGVVIAIRAIDGALLQVPTSTESYVVDEKPTLPDWATAK